MLKIWFMIKCLWIMNCLKLKSFKILVHIMFDFAYRVDGSPIVINILQSKLEFRKWLIISYCKSSSWRTFWSVWQFVFFFGYCIFTLGCNFCKYFMVKFSISKTLRKLSSDFVSVISQFDVHFCISNLGCYMTGGSCVILCYFS